MPAHIQLSAAICSVSTGKDTSGPESSVSSSEASEDCVLQRVGSDTSDNDNNYFPLANWLPAVGVTVITM